MGGGAFVFTDDTAEIFVKVVKFGGIEILIIAVVGIGNHGSVYYV